jgi:hypothetical protein
MWPGPALCPRLARPIPGSRAACGDAKRPAGRTEPTPGAAGRRRREVSVSDIQTGTVTTKDPVRLDRLEDIAQPLTAAGAATQQPHQRQAAT